MSIRPDVRAFDDSSDMFGHCRKCGRALVLLPEDRRLGFCFDCLDFLQISRKQEINEGRVFTISHDNCFAIH